VIGFKTQVGISLHVREIHERCLSGIRYPGEVRIPMTGHTRRGPNFLLMDAKLSSVKVSVPRSDYTVSNPQRHRMFGICFRFNDWANCMQGKCIFDLPSQIYRNTMSFTSRNIILIWRNLKSAIYRNKLTIDTKMFNREINHIEWTIIIASIFYQQVDISLETLSVWDF
jgi:hypothetical protein